MWSPSATHGLEAIGEAQANLERGTTSGKHVVVLIKAKHLAAHYVDTLADWATVTTPRAANTKPQVRIRSATRPQARTVR
jgi:hypothetical protein